MPHDQGPGDSDALAKVVAHVRMRADSERLTRLARLREVHEARDPERFRRIEAQMLSPERYELLISLSAVLSDGRSIDTPGSDFSVGGQRRGVAAIWHRYKGPPLPEDEAERGGALERYHLGLTDIESAIDQMLGRDPQQHRPPRLSWGGLLKALGAEGIIVTEDDLIGTPLEIELDSSAKSLLAPH